MSTGDFSIHYRPGENLRALVRGRVARHERRQAAAAARPDPGSRWVTVVLLGAAWAAAGLACWSLVGAGGMAAAAAGSALTGYGLGRREVRDAR
ncbi:MAG: hypothetical protein F4Y03_18240 [Alphaproteobacteria bacterium]|nr:hypothetical protein [Alphaproteobacteria bacterium]